MMQKIITTLLLLIVAVSAVRAQFQVEILPSAGYPFMLSGRNKHFGSVAGRLQVSYKEETASWQPYLAASVSAMELPLHNREINTLTMTMLNTSIHLGLNGIIKNDELKRSLWTISGGIGVCMLRPDDATLRMDGHETFLGYSSLMDKALFPEVELGLRWTRYPKPELGWYFGVQLLTESLWLKDSKVRYTTDIAGTQYSLNFNDIVLWPSVGAIIGWSF